VKCLHCISEKILTQKSSFYDKECPICKSVWLEKASAINYSKNENYNDITEFKAETSQNSDNQDINRDRDGNIDYYYYKKKFTNNGTVDDLFDYDRNISFISRVKVVIEKV
jgi:Zn-finger nucleic acid-binding protein